MGQENPKFKLLNGTENPPGQRTYIVLGLGRSGTSFVASVLEYLGIFMGDAPTRRTLEDGRLGRLMDKRDYDAAGEVIADYDARHDIWSVKRPSMLLHAKATEHLFRNPHYIVTHRDFLSVALAQ